MKKSIKIILIVSIILVVAIVGFVGGYLIKKLNNANKKIGELENSVKSSQKDVENNTVENDTQEDNSDINADNSNTKNENNTDNNKKTDSTKNKDSTKKTDSTKNTDSTKKSDNTQNTDNNANNNTSGFVWNGEYSNKSQTKEYYYNANIKFSNQTNDTIDFSMDASAGIDIDHVNVGQVSGTAKRISSKTNLSEGETEYDTYLFEENIDGKKYKITFIFNAHRMFSWVQVKQDFPDGLNPYAGHNVSFEGEYEKIS